MKIMSMVCAIVEGMAAPVRVRASGITAVVTAALLMPIAVHADNPKVVRVGYAPNVTHAAGIIGFCPQKQSYYKAFPGVQFNNRLVYAGPAAVTALRENKLDMAFMGPAAAISAFVSKRDVVVLTGTTQSGTVLVARPGSGIRVVSDLLRRKIAIPEAGNTQDVLLQYHLALHSIRPDSRGGKTVVVPLDNPDIVTALKGKAVDAACVPEPWGSYAENTAGAKVILGSGQVFNEGAYPSVLLVVRKDFADANPQFVGRFRDVTRNITLAINAHKAGYVEILRSEMKRLSGVEMKPVVIKNAMKRCRFTPKVNQHDLQVFAKLAEISGSVPSGVRLDGIIWQ